MKTKRKMFASCATLVARLFASPEQLNRLRDFVENPASRSGYKLIWNDKNEIVGIEKR